ncbi:MAG: type II toxin-antitoxin system RelB/DinJ family antitoxin [Oscillospiraceae bacterium]|nr:type II toxin-antitoxin system RelB/DinJ family antitoxin [Oscillospiraceae bacterium]
MAQITFSVQMDEDLKRDFETSCKECGISINTAINIFAHEALRQGRIPLEIESAEPAENRIPGMPSSIVDEEIHRKA